MGGPSNPQVMQRSPSGRVSALSHWCACWNARRSAARFCASGVSAGNAAFGPGDDRRPQACGPLAVRRGQTELAGVIVNGEAAIRIRPAGRAAAATPASPRTAAEAALSASSV